jgi:hypothetical protein
MKAEVEAFREAEERVARKKKPRATRRAATA